MLGLLTLAFAANYPELLAGAATMCVGSSIFHPESLRIARLASGGAHPVRRLAEFRPISLVLPAKLGKVQLPSSPLRRGPVFQ